MLTDIQILSVAILSIAGALFTAALGWLESSEPFNARKFTSSLLRAFVAGMVFAVTSYVSLEKVDIWTYFVAFLGGAGIDVVGNRVAGAIASRNKPATTAPP